MELFDVPVDRTPAQRLNARPALNLSGPGGRVQLPAPRYQYSVAGSDVFTPGDYTVDNGAGPSPCRLPRNGPIRTRSAPLTSAGRFAATGLDFGLFTYEQGPFNLVSFR